MDSPKDKLPYSASGPPPVQLATDSTDLLESPLPVRTDRLYQIAALAAGMILLATVF